MRCPAPAATRATSTVVPPAMWPSTRASGGPSGSSRRPSTSDGSRPIASSTIASRRLVLPAAFGPTMSCGPGPKVDVERGISPEVDQVEPFEQRSEPGLSTPGRRQDAVRTGITTCTYWSSPSGLNTPGESGPLSSSANWSASTFVRTSVRYRALKAIVVPSPSTCASTRPSLSPTSAFAVTVGPVRRRPHLELHDVRGELAMSAARRTAFRRSSRSRTARVVWVFGRTFWYVGNWPSMRRLTPGRCPRGGTESGCVARQDDVDRIVGVGQDPDQLVERPGGDHDARRPRPGPAA